MKRKTSYIKQKRTYIALHVSSLQKKCLESNIYFPKKIGAKGCLEEFVSANFFWQPKKCSQPALFHAWESSFAAAATRLCLNLPPTDPDKIDAWGLGGCCWGCWARLFGPHMIAGSYFDTKKPPIIVESESNWYFTLPETNIAPENDPLEKEIPIGNHHF